MKKRIFFLIIVFLSVLLYALKFSDQIFVNIFGTAQHAPFDGAVYVVEKVPDWLELDIERWNENYSEMDENDLMELPYYNPKELKISTDDLVWGDKEDDSIRNAKITYSVPYMGNYLLDGVEYEGSHPGVDLKIPEGTPVLAMANGVVFDISKKASGFGYSILLEHKNFPDLDDETDRIILYSFYGHLSKISVSEGELVEKGEKIGLSGNTGDSTNPHLHFQIDLDIAETDHPFWPFDKNDLLQTDLDGFEAINQGLGQQEAVLSTVNPFLYIQKYLEVDESLFLDEPVEQWIEPYMIYARGIVMIDSDEKRFKPSEGIDREELINTIYELVSKIKKPLQSDEETPSQRF
jgi:hypothetical protein